MIPNASRKKIRIAVVGNPNTGKSTLFNFLCGTRQKVGNYPGVTVERKSGFMTLNDFSVELIDLPGSYSLRADSHDERVVVDSLMGRNFELSPPDYILFILDSTNIQRNLYLFSQIAELHFPVIVALTMTDLMERSGVALDVDLLEKFLMVPILSVSASNSESLEVFKNNLNESLKMPHYPSLEFNFPLELEELVDQLYEVLKSKYRISRFDVRNLILYRNDPENAIFEKEERDRSLIDEARNTAKKLNLSVPSIIAARRYAWANGIVQHVEKRKKPGDSFLSRLDRLVTHRVFGFAIFIFVMYVMFSSIYSWSVPLMNTLDAFFHAAGSLAGEYLKTLPVVRSLFVEGVIGGVGAVVVFLPQIIFLFFFIAVLEDSGYLSRAAFLMDRLLGWSGLNGRAFIPLLSSFACTVPGVMSARIMTDARARMSTVLIAPLVSCSARLPIYVLMIGAFIEPVYGAGIAGLSLFLMHGIGLIYALPISWILNHGFLKTPHLPFVMELPPYRKPSFRNIYYRVAEASSKFIVRAGSIIFAFTIVIWALSYFPNHESARTLVLNKYGYSENTLSDKKEGTAKDAALTESNLTESVRMQMEQEIATVRLEKSFLGMTGRFIQPIFEPLGYDWKITVGILGAFPARELAISTLAILYSSDQSGAGDTSLRQKLRDEKREDGTPLFSPLLAVGLMVFFALCNQCFSTIVVVKKELNSWKWAAFSFIYMTLLAYLNAWVIYRGGLYLGFE